VGGGAKCGARGRAAAAGEERGPGELNAGAGASCPLGWPAGSPLIGEGVANKSRSAISEGTLGVLMFDILGGCAGVGSWDVSGRQ